MSYTKVSEPKREDHIFHENNCDNLIHELSTHVDSCEHDQVSKMRQIATSHKKYRLLWFPNLKEKIIYFMKIISYQMSQIK